MKLLSPSNEKQVAKCFNEIKCNNESALLDETFSFFLLHFGNEIVFASSILIAAKK